MPYYSDTMSYVSIFKCNHVKFRNTIYVIPYESIPYIEIHRTVRDAINLRNILIGIVITSIRRWQSDNWPWEAIYVLIYCQGKTPCITIAISFETQKL